MRVLPPVTGSDLYKRSMSAYTSKPWPSSPNHFPGELHHIQPNCGSHVNEAISGGREFRPDTGDGGHPGESGGRQNGLGEKDRFSYRGSPVGWGDKPLDHQPPPFNGPPGYNMSVCDGDRMDVDVEYGRHSPAARGYSSPTNSPVRGQAFPVERLFGGERRRLEYFQDGPTHNRQALGGFPPIQRPRGGHLPGHYTPPPLDPQHPFPVRGRPRGIPPRIRHPFLPPEDERARFDHHLRYPSQMRPRRPLLGLPPRRPGDWPGHHSPPAVYHGNPRGFPQPRTQSQEERHLNVTSDQSESPNDPRLHRKSVDSFPPGNHVAVRQFAGGRQLKLLGSPLKHPHKQEISSVDRVTKEHSYCQKGAKPAVVVSQDNNIKRAKLEPLKESSLPRSFLSPAPKLFSIVSKSPASGQAFTSLGIQSLSNQVEGANKMATGNARVNRTIETCKKLLMKNHKNENHWPVPKGYTLGRYSLDLSSDPDSASDEEIGEVKVQRKEDLNVKTLSVDSAEVDVPTAKLLDSVLTTSEEVTAVKPTDNSQQKNGFLKRQLLEPTGIPSSCDCSLMSHDEADKIEADQPSTRRSKRLADIVSTLAEDRLGSPSLEDVPDPPSSTVDQLPIADPESMEEEKQLRNTRYKRTVGARTTRRKMRKGFMKSVNKKKKTQSSISGKDSIPNELKRLVSEHFTPEILTIRSRGESVALARRKEMEREIEQHELERLLTSRDEPEVCGEDHTSKLRSPTDIADDLSSEHSVAMTTSSNQTLSYDLSSSHDLSSTHELDILSIKSSDSVLNQFSPELIARCKRINTARSSGDTPLHKVCRSGKLDMAQYFLLVEKVNPNKADNAGWTPLHEACGNNRSSIASLLLKNGADANISARDGTRPIHDAIEIGSLEIVKLLIQHGADPMADIGDKTPLEFSKSLEQDEIHDYLLSVIKERQERMTSQKATSSPVVARRSARTTKQTKPLVSSGEVLLTIPVDGYSSDDPHFGAELDHPMFYVCPILELSESPILPVYNFEIVSGTNPRRHNFYLLSDLLGALKMTESELRQHCSEISAVELTVGEILTNFKHSYYNTHVSLPASVGACSKTTKIKFLPLCSQLRNLLDIQVIDLED